MKVASACLALCVAVAIQARPADAEPVAYLTEIQRTGQGDVLVKPSGQAEWRPARPLLALEPGDQVRAEGGAKAVILFHAGGSTRSVASGDAPVTISAPPSAAGTAEPLRALVASVGQFLLGKQEPPTYRRLSVRSVTLPPVIISPRNTRVLRPGVFEWDGSAQARYTLRVIGPSGTIWERADLPREPVEYPSTAPPLVPGVRYEWELEVRGQPRPRAEFEVLPEAAARRVREELAVLDGATGVSSGTLSVMRAVVLFEAGLYADARKELEAAARSAPSDPTPHLLLGYVWERVGLPAKAAEAFDGAKARER